MGKRSEFTRRPRDFYPTPYKAVMPLARLLCVEDAEYFIEPCAGNGALIKHLARWGFKCVVASDIKPMAKGIQKKDALKYNPRRSCRTIITNPPWDFKFIDLFLRKCRKEQRTAWLLLSADFAHNKQSATHMHRCARILPIGRIKWIPDSKHAGKDNCAWYEFTPFCTECTFLPRGEAT